MSCTPKVGFGVGNATSQKYEAQKNIYRYKQILQGSEPSKETSRWREPQQDYKFTKDPGIEKMKHEKVALENTLMSKRMDTTVNEQREKRTHEYAPGWRIGKGGTVIDCYRSHSLDFQGEHNNKTSRIREEKKINRENKFIHHHISSVRSSYERAKQQEDYEKNRVKYQIFSNCTPPTAMHLGLVEAAMKSHKKHQAKNQMLAMDSLSQEAEYNRTQQNNDHCNEPRTLSPQTKNRIRREEKIKEREFQQRRVMGDLTLSPTALKAAEILTAGLQAGRNYHHNHHYKPHSQSSDSPQRRPHTASGTGGGAGGGGGRGGKALHNPLSSPFIGTTEKMANPSSDSEYLHLTAEMMRSQRTELMQRGSVGGGWDNTVTENLHNSNYNFKERKHTASYDEKRRSRNAPPDHPFNSLSSPYANGQQHIQTQYKEQQRQPRPATASGDMRSLYQQHHHHHQQQRQELGSRLQQQRHQQQQQQVQKDFSLYCGVGFPAASPAGGIHVLASAALEPQRSSSGAGGAGNSYNYNNIVDNYTVSGVIEPFSPVRGGSSSNAQYGGYYSPLFSSHNSPTKTTHSYEDNNEDGGLDSGSSMRRLAAIRKNVSFRDDASDDERVLSAFQDNDINGNYGEKEDKDQVDTGVRSHSNKNRDGDDDDDDTSPSPSCPPHPLLHPPPPFSLSAQLDTSDKTHPSNRPNAEHCSHTISAIVQSSPLSTAVQGHSRPFSSSPTNVDISSSNIDNNDNRNNKGFVEGGALEGSLTSSLCDGDSNNIVYFHGDGTPMVGFVRRSEDWQEIVHPHSYDTVEPEWEEWKGHDDIHAIHYAVFENQQTHHAELEMRLEWRTSKDRLAADRRRMEADLEREKRRRRQQIEAEKAQVMKEVIGIEEHVTQIGGEQDHSKSGHGLGLQVVAGAATNSPTGGYKFTGASEDGLDGEEATAINSTIAALFGGSPAVTIPPFAVGTDSGTGTKTTTGAGAGALSAVSASSTFKKIVRSKPNTPTAKAAASPTAVTADAHHAPPLGHAAAGNHESVCSATSGGMMNSEYTPFSISQLDTRENGIHNEGDNTEGVANTVAVTGDLARNDSFKKGTPGRKPRKPSTTRATWVAGNSVGSFKENDVLNGSFLRSLAKTISDDQDGDYAAQMENGGESLDSGDDKDADSNDLFNSNHPHSRRCAGGSVGTKSTSATEVARKRAPSRFAGALEKIITVPAEDRRAHMADMCMRMVEERQRRPVSIRRELLGKLTFRCENTESAISSPQALPQQVNFGVLVFDVGFLLPGSGFGDVVSAKNAFLEEARENLNTYESLYDSDRSSKGAASDDEAPFNKTIARARSEAKASGIGRNSVGRMAAATSTPPTDNNASPSHIAEEKSNVHATRDHKGSYGEKDESDFDEGLHQRILASSSRDPFDSGKTSPTYHLTRQNSGDSFKMTSYTTAINNANTINNSNPSTRHAIINTALSAHVSESASESTTNTSNTRKGSVCRTSASLMINKQASLRRFSATGGAAEVVFTAADVAPAVASMPTTVGLYLKLMPSLTSTIEKYNINALAAVCADANNIAKGHSHADTLLLPEEAALECSVYFVSITELLALSKEYKYSELEYLFTELSAFPFGFADVEDGQFTGDEIDAALLSSHRLYENELREISMRRQRQGSMFPVAQKAYVKPAALRRGASFVNAKNHDRLAEVARLSSQQKSQDQQQQKKQQQQESDLPSVVLGRIGVFPSLNSLLDPSCRHQSLILDMLSKCCKVVKKASPLDGSVETSLECIMVSSDHNTPSGGTNPNPNH